MSRLPRFTRHQEVGRIRTHLETFTFPRLQMFLLVALTGMAGFTASALLLSGGMLTMWSRYLAAFGIAYLVFLGLLWLWLRTRAEDWADLPDIANGGMPTPSHSHAHAPDLGAHDGDFGGGGASGSFDGPAGDMPVIDDAAGEVAGEALSAAAQAEEFAIPLVVIVFLATMLLSSLFLVWSAPTLFAELLVDGVLSASLYRRLRGLKTPHWVTTAIRRTAWPFAVTAVIVAILGWSMAQYAPGAHSIGEVIAHANGRQ
ncbi:MAG: hypothetical protein KJ634_03290 [Gammaproteobacteria bacterium]|nr:hypothetical protein [Gammaproteobacteria bacterium]MBU1414627.1 hypothetical protein [Gammaproteobacteria bacterium]